MDENTVTITIKGVEHYFNGNELISPEREAIEFLQKLAEDKEEF
tara:strand:+ start:44992 stop:45123 length:132 start_codon:yes stop_codon:yes gene_type:complete